LISLPRVKLKARNSNKGYDPPFVITIVSSAQFSVY